MADRELTKGSVSRLLLILSGPMAIGIFSVMPVGFAGSYFLGQIGDPELAAVGFVYPPMIAFTSLGAGLDAGANSVIFSAIGATYAGADRRPDRCRRCKTFSAP